MVRRYVLLVILCAAAVCVTVSAVVSATEKNSPDNSAGQVQKLQERLTQLETRVAALEKKQSYVVLPPTTPPLYSPSKPLPNGWQQREFNGMQYFIVPLDANKK